MTKTYDFGGWATKFGVRCSDGRVIRHGAFAENDGGRVPLVWQHIHGTPENVLGHADIEERPEGYYAWCVFNDTKQGKIAKKLVHGEDITSLSIYANQLKQAGAEVVHGVIREVSLVLSGANPGAKIDQLSLAHSDGTEVILEDEALFYNNPDGLDFDDSFLHQDEDEEGGSGGRTIGEIFDSMNEDQKNVCMLMVADVAASGVKMESGDEDDIEQSAINGGQNFMKHNAFSNVRMDEETMYHAATPEQFQETIARAKQVGKLSMAMEELAHAGTYGIDNIEYLFPDSRALQERPEFIKRDMGWVPKVFRGARSTPFAKVKTIFADLTPDEARARGYVTTNMKTEQVFALLQRETEPTTIYKKQKIDRDDELDITGFDVIAWIKVEMRFMLEEEIARAMLIGDGRPVLVSGNPNPDKINEAKIRPIYLDEDFYTHKLTLDAGTEGTDLIDAFVENRHLWKGTGTPTAFVAPSVLSKLMVLRDSDGHRMYRTLADLAAEMRVKEIIEVEVMEGVTRETGASGSEVTQDLTFIIVNMNDYNLGTNKGGQVNMFDDFDIDYNQKKFLIETRLSGALVKPKAALVIEVSQAAG